MMGYTDREIKVLKEHFLNTYILVLLSLNSERGSAVHVSSTKGRTDAEKRSCFGNL